MNPPNLPPPAPPARNPDPNIQLAHSCSKCAGPLGELRVHEGTGTTGPKSRGKLSQSVSKIIRGVFDVLISFPQCKNCHASTFHTAAYIYADACHLLVRFNCTQLARPIPADSWNAPLRFAPPPPPEPPEGNIPCPGGCLTKDGNPRKASRQCIEFKCKGCCTEAAAAVTQTGAYRDACHAHHVPGNPGAPAAPVTPVPVISLESGYP